MRVLVTGVKGQLGYDVVNEMLKRGLDPVGVDVEEMDITDKAACEKVITESNVEAVIHCAAYTAVDKCEGQVQTAAFAFDVFGFGNTGFCSHFGGAESFDFTKFRNTGGHFVNFEFQRGTVAFHCKLQIYIEILSERDFIK